MKLLKCLRRLFYGRNVESGELSLFMCGTPATTPDIFDVEAAWPRPWRFSLVLALGLLMYGLFATGWHLFTNSHLVPGLILTGSFAVPIALLILFFELNIRRNVPFYQVVILVLLGGVLSLLLSLALLYADEEVFARLGIDPYWFQSVRGVVEEFSKVAVVVTIARKTSYRNCLNGLLLGAAVGVGFSAFESAGYALTDCIVALRDAAANSGRFAGCEYVMERLCMDLSPDQRTLIEKLLGNISGGVGTPLDMLKDAVAQTENSLVVRGLLSPFSHIVWSALACAGLWWAKGSARLSWRTFANWRFCVCLAASCILHYFWNSPAELPFYAKYLILGAIAWSLVAWLVAVGIRQIGDEQKSLLKNIP